MLPEAEATYCLECRGLVINLRTHVASRYHQQHMQGSDLDAEVVRAWTARDPVFAAKVLRVEIAPEPRALVPHPEPGTEPPVAMPSPGAPSRGDDEIGDMVMDFDLLGDL
ncbi:hypothetical protein V5799_005260 [Amblyomma americanum]|uniref:Uncharacterized protein n=1 Tax=Amblyomma americanum TaxID=6943 RepID=A0AAQ4DZR9_AMBAM